MYSCCYYCFLLDLKMFPITSLSQQAVVFVSILAFCWLRHKIIKSFMACLMYPQKIPCCRTVRPESDPKLRHLIFSSIDQTIFKLYLRHPFFWVLWHHPLSETPLSLRLQSLQMTDVTCSLLSAAPSLAGACLKDLNQWLPVHSHAHVLYAVTTWTHNASKSYFPFLLVCDLWPSCWHSDCHYSHLYLVLEVSLWG